jgi:hypothetical protein
LITGETIPASSVDGGRGVCEATSIRADFNASGSSFPRFSARRRIPRQARELKKYGCGTSPVSKMPDNEDAAPSLGYSEKLCVQNSVGDPIPELDQEPEEGSKRPSVVNRQDTGDVLPHQPSGPEAISKSSKLDGEVATRVIQSRSLTGNGERLARCSSGQKVDCSHIVGSNPSEISGIHNRAIGGQSNDVANGCRAALRLFPVRCIVRTGHEHGPRCAIARAQQPTAERVDLGEHGRLPTQRSPCDRDGFDARAHGEVSHGCISGISINFDLQTVAGFR